MAQAAAHEAHVAATSFLQTKCAEELQTAVFAAQDKAMRDHQLALGHVEDMFAVQCSQASRRYDDLAAQFEAYKAQVELATASLPDRQAAVEAEHRHILATQRAEADA